jgi:DNA-binding transcriptional regulator YiaG
MSSKEAWKRAKFADELRILKWRIHHYENGDLTPDALINAIGVWHKRQLSTKNYNPQIEAVLRMEWEQTEDINLFRKYGELGMSQRDMARVCGVSAAAISRWLNGTRTKRS